MTICLTSATGVLAWDNMQTKDNNIHTINISSNDSINNETGTKTDSEKYFCELCEVWDVSWDIHKQKHTYTCETCGKKIFGDGAITH